MKRRYLIIALVVIVIIVLVVFWLFLRNLSSTSSPSGTSGTLPQTGTQSIVGGGTASSTSSNASGTSTGAAGTAARFGVVSNEPIFDYFVDAQNNVLAVEPDGKIAYITNGQASYLNSNPIQSLISADFTYDGKKIVVNFGDPTNPQTSIFDVTAKAWTPLASGISSPVWSPNDYRLAYLETATGTTSLLLLDTSKSTSKPTQLTSFSAVDLVLGWVDKNHLMLQGKPSAYVGTSAWTFDLSSKAITPIMNEVQGLEITWAKATTTTTGVAFSSGQGGRGGTVSLISANGATIQSLTFLTLASKCTFNFETPVVASTTTPTTPTTTSTASTTPSLPAVPPVLALYCAVPRVQDLFSFIHLPDDYEQMSIFTLDDIYRIDTTSGALGDVLAGQNIDVSDIKTFGNILFFVNRYDQKLYALSLLAAQ